MKFISAILVVFFAFFANSSAPAQQSRTQPQPKFGPNVQAYLDYLKEELTVTDLRESQREVSPAYVRHNFNRVSALRQFAIRLASETESDFIPEMEAVTVREFHTLFADAPPKVADLRTNEIYSGYRYLGVVRNRETFYIFARLDPFEEEAARRKTTLNKSVNAASPPQNEETNAGATKIATEAPKQNTPSRQPQQITRDRFLSGAEDKNKNLLKQPNN